ncbi:GNAT family N-acetyltransferase [Streptomyces sp. NBC_00083]|uniref:GNAT family N-acetyltransferase n=1 Tax=Streptomyces sp. NBC_00083 TaxID=2975647 RepID=UPI0022525ED6|nr:GNAT family N-acetyltransferase [Streptomyces sp. NBC_00083]MCX5382981.1 GNAT family N-acetyltransferase [Streptomyces sp. NBC_00083]
MTAFAVRVAEDPADREACFAVRQAVFVTEQQVPEDVEYDTYDAVALHVLAVGKAGPLGTGRLLYGPEALAKTGAAEIGSLGRLAVTAAARGLGVGAALVRAIEAAALDRGLSAVDLHAQTHALGFYERLGYVAYGPEFPDAGIPHRAMRRALSAPAA